VNVQQYNFSTAFYILRYAVILVCCNCCIGLLLLGYSFLSGVAMLEVTN